MGRVLKVREIGEPALGNISEDVDIKNINQEILELIEDLKETLDYGVGVGIAAPQVGVNKRIIVVGAKLEKIHYNDAEEIPVTAMINPTWRKLSEDTDIQYEGCMSVPEIRGKVKRKGKAFKHANKKGEILTKWKNGEFN